MRLDYLDFLRCVAAIAVFAQHLLERADPARFRPFLELGPGIFGVALFFLISGFVIPHSVRRGFAPADFAVRRLFRVFPAYLTVLAAVVALGALGLQPWRGTLVADGPAGFVANLALVQEYTGHAALLGVSWTLSLEFVWYGIFALVMLTGGERHAFALTLAASAGQLQLNVMEPVITFALFTSIATMENAVNSLTVNCIQGITANVEHSRDVVLNSLGIITVLKPLLGYKQCAEIARECHQSGKSLHEVVVNERQLLTEERWDEVFSFENLINPKFEN